MTFAQVFESLQRASRQEAWATLQRMSHSPRRFLYKYLPSDSQSLQSVILRSQLWLASPNTFNDPFDMALRVIVQGTPADRRAALRDLARARGIPPRDQRVFAHRSYRVDLETPFNERSRQLIHQFGVISLTAAGPRNLLMWSHYGQSHQGVCFQFHVPSSPFELATALPVSYSDKYPVINWVDREEFVSRLGGALFQKSKAWLYEREARVVLTERANSLFQLKHEAVSAIVLGANASTSLVDHVVDLLRSRLDSGLPGVRVFRGAVHKSDYKVVVCRDRRIEARCYS